ncbi:hypothetical protein Q361_1682 [Flavobacterium croceum DSM 17960]|uniref:Uncharacterized protein n=1 Tax=Flavobacterium croceum DSM 17960 TaxID=1121886 RepID=A0A2S4N476_9FLAO|nr:hypothetical protein Q361_1682 [Flavobacterium croceum DSM 17960]
MKELIILTVISGLAFLLFLVTLILGLTKKNKKLKLTSLLLFFAFIGLTAWTGFKFVSKTYNKVTETLRPRTGDEIYDALFDKRKTDCIKILNFQDQVVPKIDYAIWLHFETCPDELKRILSLHDFKTEIVSTKGWNTDGPLANENWFKPETLGDSILVFTYNKDEYGNGQYIYSSIDSTKVFLKDILD